MGVRMACPVFDSIHVFSTRCDMARKRPPSIDFYYDDFFAGVAGMHPCAVGMYVRSICFQCGKDLLPENEETLQRIMGVTPQQFAEFWPEVREKFTHVPGRGYFNERTQVEIEKKVAISEKRAAAGKKGGRPVKSKRVSKTQSKTKAQGSRKLEVGSTSSKEELTPEFDRFWDAFPRGRKKSKAKAFEAWEKAIAFGVDSETLIARAEDYAGSAEGQGQFVKMPSTWLNQRCWEDDDFAWTAKGGTNDKEQRTLTAIDEWIQGG